MKRHHRMSLSCFFRLIFISSVVFQTCRAQAQRPITDPKEARAVNAIFERWRIASDNRWNISGELCSGIASDDVTDLSFSPGIKCDCSYNGGTTCHVIALRVYAMSDWNSSSNVVGPLPDELWSLTYLTLDLGQNYLTGPLSSSVENLIRMQYLSLGINALSGELPKELGKLTDLRSLAIGTNNFSGPLPYELGNCVRLEQLWIDSSGISGPIPNSFANLRNMQILFASDVAFNGSIPDFIGRWSKLTTLRLEGNSFVGSIPSTFSNLTSMIDLRISDLSNGSSPLDFLRNMKSLSTIVLRNNIISGSIPTYLGQYERLSLLDLSFNDFAGKIPDSIFNTSSLVYLFLGNNRLIGSVPVMKNNLLQFIDLSYNQLSGNLPSWINEKSLQLNLVANNFTEEDFNSSIFESGLNCLQRSFPCNRGNPKYSSLAIKCGGERLKSAFSGIVYEADNSMNGPSAYYVSREQRWGVSNIGLPSGSSNLQYTTTTTAVTTSSIDGEDTELYRSARVSAGSLRYYGLGLENGGYNVSLRFVEHKFPDSNVWQSLGRRVFDIYIQGNLALKDFDIRKEAGGSFRAVTRDFAARVTDNHLEIHLFWAGKGTCCVPSQGTYGPSISAISITPRDFIPTFGNNGFASKNSSNNKIGLIVGITVAIVNIGLLSLLAVYYLVCRRKMIIKNSEDQELLGIKSRPYTFSYAELREATDDFSSANKLGDGGFGSVYKGTLEDGRVIAVKQQLSEPSRQVKSRELFVSEIATISSLQQRNLVKLHGFCIEGDKPFLVYEYVENKISLDQALYGNGRIFLDWPTRFNICLGVARGLAFLHEESGLRIVHRDVKARNVLLDSKFNPKISDIGLSKSFDDPKTRASTQISGTIGYLAPEYALKGHLTEKANMFAFGVIALEIVSGKSNSDSTLLELAWHCHETNRDLDLVDTNLSSDFNEDEVRRVIRVALVCTKALPSSRPSMSQVLAMLCGEIDIPIVTAKPGYLLGSI